jgi:general secretion pathway protein H
MKCRLVNIEGFTLLEILIVLMIMSLLLTLVPPLFSNALPSLTLKAVANDLSQDMSYLRNIAILKAKKSQVVIDPETGSYSSADKDRGDVKVLPKGIAINASYIGLRKADDKKPVIAFFADGSSSGGVITISQEEQAYSIVIDWITGNITLKEGLISEYLK